MAETMTDNVSGGLKELASAAEDAKIEIYDAVKPMISDALPGIKDIFGWLKSNAGNIANLLKPIGGALQIVFSLLKPVGALLSPILNVVGKITGVIGDFASTIAGDIAGIGEYAGTMTECRAEIETTTTALENAKKEYGKNSEEVEELKSKLELLNAQYERGGGDVQAYSEKAAEASDALDALSKSQEDAVDAIEDSSTKGLQAVSMLESLSKRTELTSGDLDTMSKYADYLNDTFNCDIKVNYDTGELTGFDPAAITQSIIDSANERKIQQSIDFITDADFTDRYTEAYKKYDELMKKKSTLQKAYDEMYKSADYDTFTYNGQFGQVERDLQATNSELETAKSLLGEYETALNEHGAAAEESGLSLDLYRKSLQETAVSGGELMSIAEKSSDTLTSQQTGIDAASGVIDKYRDRIESIAQAYDDAYEAAYTSFSGQFGLFDVAQADAEATVGAAKNALDSQLDYWTNYNENLKKLHSMSAEELGVTQEELDALMAKLSDGTAESANLVNELANGSSEDIADLAQKQGEVAKIREDTVKTAAEMRVDVAAEMDNVKKEMEGAIKDLKLDKEAEKSAIETIDGYIDGISGTMDEARKAAQSVVDAVRAVFNNADLSFSASGVSGSVQLEGNARGTTNAGDVFVAGEEGPELIVGKGGSTVFPFSETAKIVNAVSGLLPNFNTSGIYNSLAAPSSFPSSYESQASSSSAQPISVPQNSTFPPIVNVYIGDDQIRNFVVEAVTDANANSGGWSV